jgi:hypothetical protein
MKPKQLLRELVSLLFRASDAPGGWEIPNDPAKLLKELKASPSYPQDHDAELSLLSAAHAAIDTLPDEYGPGTQTTLYENAPETPEVEL